MHFDWAFNLGDLLAFIVPILSLIGVVYSTRYRVGTLEEWKKTHEKSSHEEALSLANSREELSALKKIAEGQDRRLIMMEDLYKAILPAVLRPPQ